MCQGNWSIFFREAQYNLAIRNMGRIFCCCVVFALCAKTTQQQVFFSSQKAFPNFDLLSINPFIRKVDLYFTLQVNFLFAS